MAPFAAARAWIVKVFLFAATGETPRRSLVIALVVGTILTLINQGSLLFQGVLPPWWKMLLTYMVPYLVSTTGAVSAMLSQEKAMVVIDSKELPI